MITVFDETEKKTALVLRLLRQFSPYLLCVSVYMTLIEFVLVRRRH